MRSDTFKKFKSVVASADSKDPIWWAGFYWVDLTKIQVNAVCEILVKRNFKRDDRGFLVLPSGVGIKEV